MSNYYISNCCSAQVTEIDIKAELGRCYKCKEMCEIIAVTDDDKITLDTLLSKSKSTK